MESNSRTQWGSSLGFVLAAAGSAVGVGNLWKFPYITWENNGGAFVIIYLISAAMVGLPILISELIIGRKAGLSAVPAMEKLGSATKGGRKWGVVGWLGLLGSAIILSYVVVIAGWALAYFFTSLKWSLGGYIPPEPGEFSAFIGNSPLQLLLAFLFMAITAWIVYKGINSGIEKANRILMPALFIMLLLLLVNAFTLSGSADAVRFLFSADFGAISTQSVLEAMGQAFFSLSLGMGIMITYGSYMKSTTSVPKAAAIVVAMDTFVAVMASIIIFSIIFTVPALRDTVEASTTGMLFTTLPALFYTELPGGVFFGPIFYLLVTFAAISSTISLLEVVVALMIDRYKLTRGKASIYSALLVLVLTIMVILSLNPQSAFSRFQFFGNAESGFFYDLNNIFFRGKAGFMNVIDHLVANWLLPITGLLTTIFVGWVISPTEVQEQLSKHQSSNQWLAKGGLFTIRFVTPLAVLYILYQILFGAQDFT